MSEGSVDNEGNIDNNNDVNEKTRRGLSTIVSEEGESEVQEQLPIEASSPNNHTKGDGNTNEEKSKTSPEAQENLDKNLGSDMSQTEHNDADADKVVEKNVIEDSPAPIKNMSSHHIQTDDHQQQIMNMNQHMQSMNLMAHYEAQMRDHLAAFTHAAAGAAWAAAQVASMSSSGVHTNDSQMNIANASSNMAAATATASSALSQLHQHSQNMSMSLPMPYVQHDPNMHSVPGPMDMNPIPMNTADASTMPPFYNPPPMQIPMHMNHLSHQSGGQWHSSKQPQYQIPHPQHMMLQPPPPPQAQPNLEDVQPKSDTQQPRQRNRGRNDYHVYQQNQPNKRHQKMQESHQLGSPQDVNISTQMQQMQFQSHSHPSPSDQVNTHLYTQTPFQNSSMAAATNKRPHSSSSWQGSLPQNHHLDGEPPFMDPYPQDVSMQGQYHHYVDSGHKTHNRTSRRLWSPNAKIENKRTMHKKYDYYSSPSNSDSQHNRNHRYHRHDSNDDTINVQSHVKHSKMNASHTDSDSTSKSNQFTRKANSSNSNRRRLHSSIDSSGNSSGGGSYSNSHNNRKNKITKKRPSHSPFSNNSPRPFNPIGKTGVMALHELCSKRHWSAPKFIEIQQPTKAAKKDSTSNNENARQTSYSPRASTLPAKSFLMSVIVHERELGRGRGGTKTAARQDAARQALSVLLPDIAFDNNGILVYVGNLNEGETKRTEQFQDELTPLASKLAIKQNHLYSLDEASSPQNSEDSFSLSHRHKNQVSKPPYIYPCASSGMSSASEDEDSYYASRGASVCSTLLHAMWQIDHRIQEPPSYHFQVCSPPILLTSSPFSSSSTNSNSATATTSKRSKGSSVPQGSSTPVPVHRSSFACTASIVLKGFNKNSKSSNGKTHILSPQELLEQNLSNITHLKNLDNQSELTSNEDSCGSKEDDKRLEATGTGATKREAKHVASAKLLSLLFPSCNGMVEVMGAAEAAREKYAASKALTKQHKRALSQLNSNQARKKDNVDGSNREFAPNVSGIKNELSSASPNSKDQAFSEHGSEPSLSIIHGKNPVVNKHGKPKEEPKLDSNQGDNFISVATLTISESKSVEPSKKPPKSSDDLAKKAIDSKELDVNDKPLLKGFPLSTCSLQAVEEEDNEEDDEDTRKEESTGKILQIKGSTGTNHYKPSKRSRVS